MITPSERTRALLWGGELLRELAGDPSTGEIDRARAVTLLRSCPTPAVLQSRVAATARVIPSEAAEAIEGAGDLFRHFQLDERWPPEIRHSLRYTLRHFPEPGHAVRWLSPGPASFFGPWLSLDEDFPW